MFTIKNFGNDTDCQDIAQLEIAIKKYAGTSVTIVDKRRPLHATLFIDIADNGDITQSYNNAPVVLSHHYAQ